MNSTDNRAVRWGMYVLSLVVLAVVWQLAAAGTGPLLASFTETMSRLVELISNGELPAALWSSGRIFLTGLVISIVLGLPLGLVFARFPLVTAAVETYVYALYAIPVITLVPFILASVGFDFRAKVLVVVLTAIFPILISAMEGTQRPTPAAGRLALLRLERAAAVGRRRDPVHRPVRGDGHQAGDRRRPGRHDHRGAVPQRDRCR